MKHFLKKDVQYNVRRHIQDPTKNPKHSLLAVELRTKRELPPNKYKFVLPTVPRRDIVDNALMVLSTTYAGEVPAQTSAMQNHFRYLRLQLQQGLMPLDEVYRQVQGYMGYHYEVLVAPKDEPDWMLSSSAVDIECTEKFNWLGKTFVCNVPYTEGFHGWVEVV